MAYSEHLANRVQLVLERKKVPFSIKKMMGGHVFMVDDKMCVGCDQDKKTKEDRLMARIGKDAYAEALAEKGVREMDFTGTVMRGFVFIYPDGHDFDEDLEFWVQKALDFNKDAKRSKRK